VLFIELVHPKSGRLLLDVPNFVETISSLLFLFKLSNSDGRGDMVFQLKFSKYSSYPKVLCLFGAHKPHVVYLVFSFNQQLGYKEGGNDLITKEFS